jgi:hypothetical protein
LREIEEHIIRYTKDTEESSPANCFDAYCIEYKEHAEKYKHQIKKTYKNRYYTIKCKNI